MFNSRCLIPNQCRIVHLDDFLLLLSFWSQKPRPVDYEYATVVDIDNDGLPGAQDLQDVPILPSDEEPQQENVAAGKPSNPSIRNSLGAALPTLRQCVARALLVARKNFHQSYWQSASVSFTCAAYVRRQIVEARNIEWWWVPLFQSPHLAAWSNHPSFKLRSWFLQSLDYLLSNSWTLQSFYIYSFCGVPTHFWIVNLHLFSCFPHHWYQLP